MCEMYLQDNLASGWASAARIAAVGEKVDTTAQARGRPRARCRNPLGGRAKPFRDEIQGESAGLFSAGCQNNDVRHAAALSENMDPEQGVL